MRLSKQAIANTADMIDALELLGFEPLEMNFFRRIEDIDSDSQLIIYCELSLDDKVKITVYEDANQVKSDSISSPIELIDYIDNLLKSYKLPELKLEPLDSSITVNGRPIVAKTTTKDFANKLQRVKSSNVWSYAFNPRDNFKGDMLMQFKGSNGGPGDIYIYYDVPSKLWRKFVAAPSKGAFFWRNFRNKFRYAKLTGDKKTKLPNGL